MESIALSWILRIQELEAILHSKQQELEAQHEKRQEAEVLLGQMLEDQRRVQQYAMEVQLQKAQLQFTTFKLESEVGRKEVRDKTTSSDSLAGKQQQLDQVINQKQRLAAKMKEEQKEIHEFIQMMKSRQMDKQQSIADLQHKLAEQRNLTAATRHEASLLKQSLGHSQQEENSLETSLAEIKQRLAHKQDENNKLISQIQEQQLACAKEAEKIQERLTAQKKLLGHVLNEKRQGERRMCQEQAISTALIKRRQQLRTQLEKIKQTVLVLSE